MSNNLSIGSEAKIGYERVLKGDPAIDWAIFSLASAGNELKLQSTGSGLDDLEEEFMDGRIQYAFARVEDPNSQLEKFVQINWCGDGVAERQKGLFNIYSPQVATFLKNSHIVLQARSEADVTSQQIRKRLNESSGSKYTPGIVGAGSAPSAGSFGRGGDEPTQAQSPARKAVPAIFAKPAAFGSAAANKPVESAPPPVSQKPAPTGPSGASGAYSFSKPTPGASVPVAAATPAPAAMEPVKPKEDDRIAAVGTAYTPVSMPKPGKLANRWGAGSTPAGGDDDTPSAPKAAEPSKSNFGAARGAFSGRGGGTGGFGGFKGIDQVNYGGNKAGSGAGAAAGPSPGKKLTWSERQAEAKREREEEEQGAQSAMDKVAPTPSIARGNSFAPPPAAASRTPSFAPPPPASSAPSLPGRSLPPAATAIPPRASDDDDEEKEEEDNDDWEAPAPPPPPPPMPVAEEPAQAAPEEEEEESYPPPPTPPPLPNFDDDAGVKEITKLKSELTLGGGAAAPPVPVGTRPGASAPAGPKAVAAYDYEAAEDNELSMTEGETITDIEQTDDAWWTGTNSKGDRGLFPSNYVELSGDEGEAEEDEPAPPPPPPMPEATPAALPPRSMPPPPAASAASKKGKWAIAAYDYEQAEENELSFQEGEEITEIEETDEAWWTGTNKKGEVGLFPANYVELQ